MIDFVFPHNMDWPDDEDYQSLVEQIFPNPKTVGEGEYTTIYEFLLDPDIRDDSEAIAGVLKEFAGWAQYMLEQMQGLSLISETND